MQKLIQSFRPVTPIVTFCLLLGFAATASAQNVQSDYEIQKTYKQQVQAIGEAIADAESAAAIDTLVTRIDSLEKNYADHQTLINKVIYPETFDEQIKALKKQAVGTRQYLATIREQAQQLHKLNNQLSAYSSRLSRLTNSTDSLQTVVQRTERSQSQLAAEVEDYKNQLRQRDELILSFIDSVVVNYQKLGVNSFNQIEKTASERRLNVEGNPLELIRSISRGSTELLQSENTFTPEDYLRMKAVNKEFSRMWGIVGEELSIIYSENPDKTQEEIQQHIQKWEESLDVQLWASLQQSFEEKGIELSEFHSDTAFYSAINSYVNQAAAQSRKKGNEDAYETYNKFTDFWNNTVKQHWIDHMTHAEMMSSTQVAKIDQKVNQWASFFTEEESNLLSYLLGGSLLVLAILGFMLFREKRNGTGKRSDSNPKKD